MIIMMIWLHGSTTVVESEVKKKPDLRFLFCFFYYLLSSEGILHATADDENVKPAQIDLQELSSAEIIIKFSGEIVLEGETKFLTYIQPIPSDDETQKIMEVRAETGEIGNGIFRYDVFKDDSGNRIVLHWQNISLPRVSYEIFVKVRRESFGYQILSTTKGEDDAMLRSGELTSSSSEIKKTVSSVIGGVKDDIEKTLKLAYWVNANIQYDKNYSQNKKDKPAPVVISKKRGTCDEISHLFISMCRCAGIPAREVSGIAFDGSVWGFHSWSEVKIGKQWIPFDATNMQTGFVDITHIAFARDYDDAKFEQKITALGTGGFKVQKHEMDVKIWKASRLKKMLEMGLESIPSEVEPGKELTLSAGIKNVSDSLLVGSVRIVLPPEILLKSPNRQIFLIPAGEKKFVQWKAETNKMVKGGYWVYRVFALSFPRVMAEAEFKVGARMIQNMNAVLENDGRVSVEVSFRNSSGKAEPFKIKACFYDSWEMKNQVACFNEEGVTEPLKITESVVKTDFVPSGNFAVRIEIECEGLIETSILKVNTGKN